MRYGARVACPSTGREVRRAVLRCHSPPRALRRRLAVGVRSRAGPPQSPHAGSQGSRRPRVCAEPGPAAASPSPAPAPFPCPPAAAARAHVPARSVPGCTASAAGGLRGGRDRAGWERGSWSAAVLAPPVAGEGSRRVSVGREREVVLVPGPCRP